MIKEIYYFNRDSILEKISEIDYVKINDTNRKYINSNFLNTHSKLIKQDGTYGGLIYINKNNQFNNQDKIINSTTISTMTTSTGIIMYMFPFNSLFTQAGEIVYPKPIYTSGGYLNKNIFIRAEVLNNPEETRKVTIIY